MSSNIHNVHCGDATSMPPALRQATEHLRHKVLYWSATDPSQPIQEALWCIGVGPLLMLPCFWPHLIILGVPFCCVAWCGTQDVLARYIVITESTVEVVEVEHDKCCIPGCYRKGQEINSIPLEQINDVQTEAKSKGCVTSCVPQFTEMRILTPSNSIIVGRGQVPGLAVYAHTDIQELRNRIFAQKDAAKHGGMGMGMGMGGTGIQMMQRDSGQQSLEKLGALKNMLDSGLITQKEFDAKKKDILTSM